jgi:peptidoglycan/xylan/chitin deacetylase (PgdA/CDA1 family)
MVLPLVERRLLDPVSLWGGSLRGLMRNSLKVAERKRLREAGRLLAPRSETGVEAPGNRARAPFVALHRKISSRMARHIALERRRLANLSPMVSFTFDDAAASAGALGAELLESRGARGTFYIASGLMGRKDCGYDLVDGDRVRRLHRKGHEIGLHGHQHRAAGAFSAQEFRADLAENRDRLEAIDAGIRPRNFAYPYGLASFARKTQLYGLVESSRGVLPGINSGDFDPQFLRCVELADARLSRAALANYLDAAARANGWLIFCSHDIGDAPSKYGCTPALFQCALDGAASRALEIVTIAEALERSCVVGS